jgi:RNA polymerase sigma-70 factor (ECF subfamily)
MMERAMRAEDPPSTDRRPPELDRATLLRCRAQDPIAFQVFVVRYERLVFALLSQMLGRGPHVDDLAQETFLRAYLAFPRFDLDRARPSRWLITIATRLALNEKRRRGPVPGEGPELAETANPESESARHELGRAIERAIALLSEDQRAVFVLAELHDMTLAEIAEALGIPENTVKTRLFRARERLRARLERLGRGGQHGSF